jgi:ribosome assembly protein YihI (activator of Der GTPase)
MRVHARRRLAAATDPVVEVNDGVPIRPDFPRERTREEWEQEIRRRKRRAPPKPPESGKRAPDSGHVIDEYAKAPANSYPSRLTHLPAPRSPCSMTPPFW